MDGPNTQEWLLHLEGLSQCWDPQKNQVMESHDFQGPNNRQLKWGQFWMDFKPMERSTWNGFKLDSDPTHRGWIFAMGEGVFVRPRRASHGDSKQCHTVIYWTVELE